MVAGSGGIVVMMRGRIPVMKPRSIMVVVTGSVVVVMMLVGVP
jgi:hypothetical protein